MIGSHFFRIILFVLGTSLSVEAFGAPCSQVISVIDSNTVLCREAKKLKLAGLLSLELLPQYVDKQTLLRVKALLQALTLKKDISMTAGEMQQDRYQRNVAHVYAGSHWVQGVLLSQGLAAVYIDGNNTLLIQEMLAIEQKARNARLGIWGNPNFRFKTPKSVLTKGFALVEGTVLRVSSGRELTYLNFGKDWKKDFTVAIKKSNVENFKRAGFDLNALTGKKVRVRGWVNTYNGPMIEIRHPEQLEIRSK